MPIRHEIQGLGNIIVDIAMVVVYIPVQREWKYLHVREQQIRICGTGIEQPQVLEQLQVHGR